MKIRLLLFLGFAAIGLVWMSSSLPTTSPRETAATNISRLDPPDAGKRPEPIKGPRQFSAPTSAASTAAEDVSATMPTAQDLVPMTEAEAQMEVNGGIAGTVQTGEIIPQVEGEIVPMRELTAEEAEWEVNGRAP